MKHFLIIIGLAFLVGTSQGQVVKDSLKMNQMKEVTVVGGLSGSFAMPMSVVNKTTLESNSFFTPADALQRQTGISLYRDGSWATSVNIRGLSEQRLLFLVDGDRIQTSSDIAAALSTVDMASLEKIEVIKGASSVLFGSGAMGGIVNFVSQRPTYSEFFHVGGKVASGYNSVNSLWDNSANLNFTTNQWYIALNGSYRTAQNTQSPTGTILSSQFHDASWGLKAGIKYAANQEFLVNYQHVGAWDIGIPGVNAFPGFAQARYKKVDRNQLSGEYIITDINDYLTKLSLKAYTQNISRDVESILKPASTVLYPSSTNSTTGAKVTSDWQLDSKHLLVVGAEGWLRQSETIRFKDKTMSATKDSIMVEQPVANARMLDIGAFAYYSWKIVPTKLTLNAGVRLDYIRTENDSAFNPVFIYNVIDGVKTDVKNITRSTLFAANVVPEMAYAAHIDLLYNLTHNQTVSLSLANSYRAASIDERFKYIDLGASTRVGNPDLKPERGTFANLNYTLSASKIQIKTDVFANYLFNLITEKSGTYLGRAAMINTNISRALFLGAEVEANWIICNHFSLLANASYTHARDVDSNSPLPQIPPMSGFVALNYHSGNLFEATFSSSWAVKATQSEIATGEFVTPGHLLFNFDVHSTPIYLNKVYLQLFAGVDNLLNTNYFNFLTTNRLNQTIDNRIPEPGRNIYLKAKLKF